MLTIFVPIKLQASKPPEKVRRKRKSSKRDKLPPYRETAAATLKGNDNECQPCEISPTIALQVNETGEQTEIKDLDVLIVFVCSVASRVLMLLFRCFYFIIFQLELTCGDDICDLLESETGEIDTNV